MIHMLIGRFIPSIAFGTWKLGNGDGPTHQVDQAISVGFSHVDTAQAYANEHEAGKAIRESGLRREEVYVTTKFSGRDGLGISESIEKSLKEVR
jgi:diketogulonate reductase-like aldo/keto reductase